MNTATATTLIAAAIANLETLIEQLREWAQATSPDYVVISKDYMHVVCESNGFAKVGIYPALPTVFYSKNVANTLATTFKATKGLGGDQKQIQWMVINAKFYAEATIVDYTQRIADLTKIAATSI